MDIFTSHIEFSHFQYIAKQNLAYLKDEEIVANPSTPSMVVYRFTFGDRRWIVNFHHQVVRFGFSGTLISMGVENFNYENGDEDMMFKVTKILAECLGGFIFQHGDETIDGFERADNASWVIRRLLATGMPEEKLDEFLDNLLLQTEANKNRSREGN